MNHLEKKGHDMKTVTIDCTNFQAADDGNTTHFAGEIVISDGKKKEVIDCNGKTDRCDHPVIEMDELWPTFFGFKIKDLEEFDLLDFFHSTITAGIPGQITIIKSKMFDEDPSDDVQVEEWLDQLFVETKTNELTEDELRLISLGLSTLGPDYESVLAKVNKLIEK